MTEHPPADHAQPNDRGVMIVLAYLPPLSIIPLLVEKDDAELRWHAKHGLVLMVAEFIVILGLFALTTVLGLLTAGLFCAAYGVLPALFLVFLAIHAVAAVRGLNGGRLIIPGISDYVSRF
ncbi:MAG: hypothetical protein IMZ44_04720 [Planctomycetes bacterium]|nr:hypothetical protein [Planctomycetota bacterium]